MRFDDRFLEELKARLRPSDIIGRSVTLRRQGREFVGLSPGATGYLVEPGEGDEWLPDPLPGSPEGFWPMRLERGYEREENEVGRRS